MWSNRPKAHRIIIIISLQIIPFFQNSCFEDLEQKTKQFHFQLPHPHNSILNGNDDSPFINLCNLFFLRGNPDWFICVIFVEMCKIYMFICTGIVGSGYLSFFRNGFLNFCFRKDRISGFGWVDVWRLRLGCGVLGMIVSPL